MKERRYLAADIDPAAAANVQRCRQQALQLIFREFSDDRRLHEDAAAAVDTGYDGMRPAALLEQLRTYSRILEALKSNTERLQEMGALLATLLRAGIYKVDGAALDAVTVRREVIQFEIDGQTRLLRILNSDILTILSLSKESRETERQLLVVDRLVNDRSGERIEAVAQAFKIAFNEAERLTVQVGRLFDDQGNFSRPTFDAMLGDLAQHGNNAFELLWCYLKVMKGRTNRIGFLNALQHLISRIERPKSALRFLLADLCRYPDRIGFSDRNAVMLANILLRTYNKELGADIEMTPEEVMNVRNGLDRDLVHYAQFRIDAMEYRFGTKVRTIHDKMIALFNSPAPGNHTPSVRHLLYLEREIFIFLALLSGRTARLILGSALNEYGEPEEGVYRHRGAEAVVPVLLQHLKIIVRGIGRVGTIEEVDRLRQIRAHSAKLAQLQATPENERVVMRIVEWIDTVIRSLSAAQRQ